MKKSAILALMLALALLLTGCAAQESDNAKREVVRVGNVAYTMEELTGLEDYLRYYYDSMGQMYMLYYGFNPMTYTDADIRNEALNSLALQAVVLDKAEQLKLTTLTAEETAQLNASAAEQMAAYREEAKASLTLEEGATEEQIAAAVDAELVAQGVTMERLLKTERENLLFQKAEDYATKDVTVSEEEFVTAFNEQVETEKTNYASNLSAYGASVLNGETPLYTPAGYRYVKQILIKYSEEDTTLISGIDMALYTAEADVSSAASQLTTLLGEDADVEALVSEVTVTLNEVTNPAEVTVKESTTAFTNEMGEDVAAAVVALAEARAVAAEYEKQLEAAIETALANIAPRADEVLSRLAAGEDWNALSAEYNEDPGMMEGQATAETGYPVCEGFSSFDPAFVEAAMGIETIGQWSDKTVGESYGYYIIQYTADATEGVVDMETVRESMMEELLTAKKDDTFSAALDKWFADAEKRILINYELLAN